VTRKRGSAIADTGAQEVFAPRPSFGWAWVLATGLFVLALLAAVMAPILGEGMPQEGRWILLGTGAVMVLLAAYMLVVAALFPTMRYELTERELVLRYGPFRYRVPYADVEDVRRRDLQWTVWSSMRFPGLALGGVLYSDAGKVYMVSTRAAEGVLLVTTPSRKYGMTPLEEERFADALKARIQGASRDPQPPAATDAPPPAGT
jgi:hypothetical protein